MMSIPHLSNPLKDQEKKRDLKKDVKHVKKEGKKRIYADH